MTFNRGASSTAAATEPGDGFGLISFHSQFIDEPFSSTTFDPLVFHRSEFGDNRYRILYQDGDLDEMFIQSTDDFSSYTEEASGLYTGVAATEGDSFQDHFRKDDGTWVVYQTDDSAGTTRVWTGATLTGLSDQGVAVSEPDCGVWHEESTGTVHIYTEDSDNAVGAGSDKLSHWTTPDDDLMNPTQQSDAIDLTSSDSPWHTGDPDIIEIEGIYYMFMDNTQSHPDYRIALATSTDLDDWEIWAANINPGQQNDDFAGGDLTVTRNGAWFEGFVEFSQYDGMNHNGIGHWRLHPISLPPFITVRAQPPTNNGGKPDLGDLVIHQRPVTQDNDGSGVAFTDQNGAIVGRIQRFNDNLSLDSLVGNGLRFGIAETGSAELVINENTSTQFDRQGSNVFNLYDDQSIDMGAQDLSLLSLGSSEDGQIYRHNGANSISADGGSTSSEGYYVWDNSASEFKSMVQF